MLLTPRGTELRFPFAISWPQLVLGTPLALSLIGLLLIYLANSACRRIPALLGRYRDGLAPFRFGQRRALSIVDRLHACNR